MKAVTQEQIDAWKAEHGDILSIDFPDGTWCCLKTPDRLTLGLAYSKAKKSVHAFGETIFNYCWLDGDASIKTDDAKLMGMPELIENEVGMLCKVERKGEKIHFNFYDGKGFVISKPNRQITGQAINAARKDPFDMVETILQYCWVSGDKEVKTEVKYLITILSEIDSVIEVAVGQVKKI